MGTIGSIISWVVFGLVIGLIARFLYPGRQPMGLLTTMVLGIVGSLVGGFISWGLGFRPEEGAFRGAGWIMSILGALIVVWVSLYLSSRSTPGTRVP
ncbi:MAG TPA: GlsB/YeaQ/YmgE family stress response membrane protein [Pirellulaceae bacterium]|nr:GlsB/YeaQ/YmgE family stress response membrane protein [Pirellulaceae bacterium]